MFVFSSVSVYFQQNDNNYPGSSVGHFISVVWAGITGVGAAIYYCPSDGWTYLAFCSDVYSYGYCNGEWGNNMKCPKDTQGLTGSLACNNC